MAAIFLISPIIVLGGFVVTTVAITEQTRDMLKQIGSKGETYDEIIRKVLEIAKHELCFQKWDRMLKSEEFVPLDKL